MPHDQVQEQLDALSLAKLRQAVQGAGTGAITVQGAGSDEHWRRIVAGS